MKEPLNPNGKIVWASSTTELRSHLLPLRPATIFLFTTLLFALLLIPPSCDEMPVDEGEHDNPKDPKNPGYVKNQPPFIPTNPSPADDATDVSTSTTLSWTCSDPNGDAL
ncbi:MAG: hypothetical protein V2A56_12015, partial [bacterium]